jgi:hypothetical protein
MGKLTPEKRAKITDKVLGVVKRLDNKKNMSNYNRYKDHLEGMSDLEFEVWANSMGHELDDTIQMFQLPFEEMKMTQIKDAADFLKIPLEEYVWYRHNDPEGIRTKMRVPVGYVHVKRVQQLLAKKNRYAFDTEEIELKSGQVKGESKVASISDPETFALSAINANAALKEFLGPRADNHSQKMEMYRQIMKDGYSTLSSLTEDISKSVTLNTINTYLLASGIRSDLITKGMKTMFTIDEELEQQKQKK